jgi:DNA-binding beta-propeller fold protein YncE
MQCSGRHRRNCGYSWLGLAFRSVLSMVLAVGVGTAAVSAAVAATKVSQSNSLLAIHESGSVIACANRDSGTVTFVEWPGLQKRSEVRVGLHPECVAWIPGTKLLACCVYGEDRIDVIDSTRGEVVRQIDVFDEPYGVVCSSDGRWLYATLEYPGQVVRIDAQTWKVDAEWAAGRMPRGIAVSPDDQSLWVTEYLSARLLQLSTTDGRVLNSFEPVSTDNLCRQLTLSPDGTKAYLTHIRSRITAAHGNGSIFPYVTVVTLTGEKAGYRVRVPMDSLRGARVTANPAEVAITPDGKRLFVVFGGTNDMYACSVLNDGYQELDYEHGARLGTNPRAVSVTPDGTAVLVYNALDFELMALRIPDLQPVGTCRVTENPLSEEVLLGKKLFYTALQPMSSRNWISCSSCHPDGDSDGRTWQQPEGLRGTQPLAGLAWTHPVHWSADRDEVQDFEHTVRGLLMQGQGLMQGRLPDALGEPISGRSQMLDALAAYTNSHRFTLSPHARPGLSESAARGKELFFSDRTKCASCHSGPFYSDSQPRPAAELVRHDVGTGADDPTEKMDPAYDTPTLLGLYRSAPYLHHGKAETLRDVLTTWNKGDRHGVTSGLSSSDVDDLVEFLKALPFEDPEPAARTSGLRQVIK